MARTIRQHGAEVYEGVGDPEVFDRWVRRFEKLFITFETPAEMQVGIASYYLEGEADRWWRVSRESVRASRTEIRGGVSIGIILGWTEFVAALRR